MIMLVKITLSAHNENSRKGKKEQLNIRTIELRSGSLSPTIPTGQWMVLLCDDKPRHCDEPSHFRVAKKQYLPISRDRFVPRDDGFNTYFH